MMKKILIASLFLGSTIANAQKADDVPTLAAIYDNILVPNTQKLVGTCQNMQETLKTAKPEDFPLKVPFSELVKAWKQVETAYILGYIDVDAMDYPFYVDTFHMGNEKLSTALDRALKSDSEPEKALFKNSYKTINALEYLLFTEPYNERRIQLAKVATDNLCKYFSKMETTIEGAKEEYLQDYAKSTALLINALIESVYKTKEWRLGDAAGLSRKYSGQPDPERAEYRLSGDSLAAIKAILATHEQLIGKDNQPNLATLAENNGAGEAIALAQTDLQKAVEIANGMQEGEALTPENAQALFSSLSTLQSDYYQHLVKALGVVAKILEADGD